MQKVSIFIFILTFFSTYLPCEEDQEKGKSYQSLFAQKVVEGNNRFAFDFFEKIKQQPGNLCFSPYSIIFGLATVASGAKGETVNQFQDFFHFSRSLLPIFGDLNAEWLSSQTSKMIPQIFLGNALWLQKDLSIVPSYKFSSKYGLGQDLQTIDFPKGLTTVQFINQWISNQTAGKINNLLNLTDINRETRLLLTTSFCMKGGWAIPFDSKETKRLPFQTSLQKHSLTEMLHLTATLSLLKGEKWDLLILPYVKEEHGIQLAMALIVPKEGKLEELENQFTFENWKEWLKLLQSEPVEVTIPRFRVEKRFDLNAPLKSMGLSIVFTPQADLSGMTDEKEIFLNKVLHKSMIRIDEKGSDFTSFIPSAGKTKIEGSYEFKADRPFLFIIWEQGSQTILLMGRVALP